MYLCTVLYVQLSIYVYTDEMLFQVEGLTGALFLHQIIVHTVVITPEGGIFSRLCFFFFLEKIRLIFLLFFNLVVLFVGKVIF